MENQKNFVQHVVKNNDILPIEEEFLFEFKQLIEKQLGAPIEKLEKYSTEVLYDSFLVVCKGKPLIIKVNLSPDLPNFWKELGEHEFSFHPKIICHSKESDVVKFLCFELPKGIFLSHISNYPFNVKPDFIRPFVKSLKSMHATKVFDKDQTIDIFNSFCPMEASMIVQTFPVAYLMGTLKILFKDIYKSNIEDCGLCHFDLSPQNIIHCDNEFKFINFEYAAHANIYIDMWLGKETLNVSERAFSKFLDFYEVNKNKLHAYRLAADMFSFAYFNSKIIAEYMTFGLRDHLNLKYWINKSRENYLKVSNKLFIDKKLDNQIIKFYNLWK